MPISVIPKFLQKAFAATGSKADIPVNADLVNGRAGYNEGFPPINMTAVAAGGIPPYGQDMNGVLYDISSAIQYLQSGVSFPFNSTFATAIGGYGVGAIVSDASDNSLLWVNGTANNTAFPTGWTQFSLKQSTTSTLGVAKIATTAIAQAWTNDTDIITPKKLADAFSGSNISLVSNGFEKLPSGLIKQWGYVASPANYVALVDFAFSFPIAFPNNCLNLQVTNFGTNGKVQPTQSYINSRTQGAVKWAVNGTAAGELAIQFFAIGY